MGPQFITNTVEGDDILYSSLKVGSTFELFVSGSFIGLLGTPGIPGTEIIMFLSFNDLPTGEQTSSTFCEIKMNGISDTSQNHDFTINSVFRILQLTSSFSIVILWSAESSVMTEVIITTDPLKTEIITKNTSNRLGRPVNTPDTSGEGFTLIPQLGFLINQADSFSIQNFYIRRIV
jgi:hypothetical protein